tara:strand:- start:9335 stop:10315 length:981 start_codon:yes stop_codon:yes gene_type:complete
LKKNLLICTPLEGIDNTLQRLENLFKISYLPDAKFEDLKNLDERNTEIIFTNPNRSKVFFGNEVFDLFPKLKIICTASTGTVHIDLVECERREISIISLKNEVNFLSQVTSTAELAFTMMLTMVRKISPAVHDVYLDNWDCEKFIGKQIQDLNIGVLGMGRLGKIFSTYCNAFDPKLSFYDPFVDKSPFPWIEKIENLEEFLSDLDVLSIHIHATEENYNFIDKDFLKATKKDICLINTSRGEVINEKDLVEFMKQYDEFTFATDVLKDEIKNRKNSPIFKYFKEHYPSKKIIITPHIGGMSEGARNLAYNKAIDLLEEFLNEHKA